MTADINTQLDKLNNLNELYAFTMQLHKEKELDEKSKDETGELGGHTYTIKKTKGSVTLKQIKEKFDALLEKPFKGDAPDIIIGWFQKTERDAEGVGRFFGGTVKDRIEDFNDAYRAMEKYFTDDHRSPLGGVPRMFNRLEDLIDGDWNWTVGDLKDIKELQTNVKVRLENKKFLLAHIQDLFARLRQINNLKGGSAQGEMENLPKDLKEIYEKIKPYEGISQKFRYIRALNWEKPADLEEPPSRKRAMGGDWSEPGEKK